MAVDVVKAMTMAAFEVKFTVVDLLINWTLWGELRRRGWVKVPG